ncbi:NAD(+) diphosphatase [Photobacterium sanctipauli]|uniref:NAD(+) diphosphatase n=1 Tax=Photobacterium sanctipauli TaxID=1342794 RepID=A0A2T3NDC3_9GAMM|nr:NAD(+) diphosphatase [Photobacterium sanctipauli]PSW12139.1 NAD(+) diphosphatase [Photobacterium sanctipauli]
MLKKQELAYWCLVKDRALYLPNRTLPLVSSDALPIDSKGAIKIGEYQGHPVYWLDVVGETVLEPLYSQRELLALDGALFNLAGKACQLSHMRHSQRYCAQCGAECQLGTKELAMVCSQCNSHHYPRLSPCVIVAVRKDDKILLAQHPRHKTGMYTVIAGFVEAGETLEQCVAREVEEETGIVVTNIRYFGSQPWAFPSNLMMGFLADYQAGELKPDYEELSDAVWASAGELPELAPPGTIARALIEQTLVLMAEN